MNTSINNLCMDTHIYTCVSAAIEAGNRDYVFIASMALVKPCAFMRVTGTLQPSVFWRQSHRHINF